MNKEMFISSSPHETKVAVCEDGHLVEVYFERDTDVGLVGGIYKGRVNRVLPGMQSAFVDIGLERDAFLYVSDFSLQDQDEFEGLLNESQARGATIQVEPQVQSAETGATASAEQPEAAGPNEADAGETESAAPEASAPAAAAEPSSAEPARTSQPAQGSSGDERDFHRRSHRGRRRRGRHGRGSFGDRRQQGRHAEPRHEAPKAEPAAETADDFEILPGESLAKYRHSDSEDSPAVEARQQGWHEHPDAEADQPEPSSADARTSEAEEIAAEVESASQSDITIRQEQAESARFVAPVSAFTAEENESQEESSAEASELEAEAGNESEEGEEGSGETSFESTEEEMQSAESVYSESDDDPQEETAMASDEDSGTEADGEGEVQPAGASEGTGEKAERSYTLREPHARPHFAPRRGRRGRRRAGRHSRRNTGREREAARPTSQQGVQISELLKEGQEIIVQIAKEPLGTKGARITSHVALPGRYVVFMPTITHVGVSRKIASEQERLRLRNVVMEHKGTLAGGFIVRTAAEGRSDDEIRADLRFLTNLWNDIRTRAEQVKAPALLYRDLDLAQRLMRDLVTPDFKSIWLDNEADYERVVEFVSRLQPSLVGCAKLHTKLSSLFDEHGIEDEIEKALKPKVWLKSGGYIVINQTEALVAIDVNTGKYVGKTNRLEDTIVKTNIDAVNEIVRQIRLRDLGGIIVIDFIDMDERRNRNKVVQALEEALRRDRAPTKVLSFNDFGLVAVTRKRVKQSLERTLCDPCTYCNGSGWVKSVSTVTNEILAEARKMAGEIEGKSMTLRVNPEVAQELKSKDGVIIREIEALTHKNLVIKSDPTIHQERFEIF
jgi:ribonuclease G